MVASVILAMIKFGFRFDQIWVLGSSNLGFGIGFLYNLAGQEFLCFVFLNLNVANLLCGCIV